MDIRDNVPLAPLTTLGIGGPARYFAELREAAEIPAAVAWARERHLPLLVLGGGSNLLVSDRGFPGLALRVNLRGIAEAGARAHGREFEVAAGEEWDGFVAWAVERDLAGVECLSGIPGSAGATPIQNVGAYGQEVDETVVAVQAWDTASGRMATLSRAECGFAYRSSIFNREARGRFIVTAVRYRLRPHAPPELRYAELQLRFRGQPAPPLAAVREAVRDIRRSKAMLLDPSDPESRSAGSFFKNPVIDRAQLAQVTARAGEAPATFAVLDAERRLQAEVVKIPAAWLIERAGFAKGFALPGSRAALSRRHVLAVVNRGGATAEEALALAATVRGGVAERFGIRLAIEPECVGFDAGSSA